MNTYLVGGAVRDKLLGLEGSDNDWVVVGSTPEKLKQLGFVPVGQDFPVFLHPETKEEYALARTERKRSIGYKGFECHFESNVTIEDDLKRRDLTINAMAQDPNQHTLIDPYDGQRDIADRWLRHVSDAFIEDPLRVLRVARFKARFHALGFKIHPETRKLMQKISLSDELHSLSPERVWQELYKALTTAHPEQFLRALRECGALKILFPEIDRLYGVPATVNWHPEIDTGIHLEMVMESTAKLSAEPSVRFAALLHDLGKGITARNRWPKHYGHEENSRELIQTFCMKWRVPKKFETLALLVGQYHGLCHRILDDRSPKAMHTLLRKLNLFKEPELLENFLLACEGDASGRKLKSPQTYPQAMFIREAYIQCRDIPTADIINAGYQGKAIQEQIQIKRLELLSKFYHENFEKYTAGKR